MTRLYDEQEEKTKIKIKQICNGYTETEYIQMVSKIKSTKKKKGKQATQMNKQ